MPDLAGAAGAALRGLALALAAPAAAFDVREIDLATNDLVYDAGTRRLYASVPGADPAYGDLVLAIDPATGSVLDALLPGVGREPNALALAADSSRLYVGLDATGEVQEILLAPTQMQAGIRFSLGSDPVWGPYAAEDLAVQPGSPTVVAVSLRNPRQSPRHVGVAVFDRGAMRAGVTQARSGSNRIEFSESPQLLYGWESESSLGKFRQVAIGSTGATETGAWPGLITPFARDIAFAAGRLYATTGEVLDPALPSLLGRFDLREPNGAGLLAWAVVPDAAAGSVHFLTRTGILSFDVDGFRRLAWTPLAIAGTRPGSLVDWGGGFAFRTNAGKLYLLDGFPPADTDRDGVPDDVDLCPDAFDPQQLDGDGDGLGDLCDPFPDAANNEAAQCRVELERVEATLDACVAESRFADADADGEHDSTDLCPGSSPDAAVDAAGCSLAQFCAGHDRRDCGHADWRNDSPRGPGGDCRLGRRGCGVR